MHGQVQHVAVCYYSNETMTAQSSNDLWQDDDEPFYGEKDSTAQAIAECDDLRGLCSVNLPRSKAGRKTMHIITALWFVTTQNKCLLFNLRFGSLVSVELALCIHIFSSQFLQWERSISVGLDIRRGISGDGRGLLDRDLDCKALLDAC